MSGVNVIDINGDRMKSSSIIQRILFGFGFIITAIISVAQFVTTLALGALIAGAAMALS